jgi:hypothetical protein
MSLLSDFLIILVEYIFLRPAFFVYEHKRIILTLILLIGVFYFRDQIFACYSYVVILYKGSSNGDKLVFLGVLITVAATIISSAFFSKK